MDSSKAVWTSKTFWVNIVAVVGIIAQVSTGTEVIDVEAQVAILAVINLILRLVTGKPITWRK